MNQYAKILNLLDDGQWHCTSEMAALYMIDYRRRLIDLKDKGYKFENRFCTKHSHSMKEWRLVGKTASNLPPTAPQKPLSDTAKAFLDKFCKPVVKERTLF